MKSILHIDKIAYLKYQKKRNAVGLRWSVIVYGAQSARHSNDITQRLIFASNLNFEPTENLLIAMNLGQSAQKLLFCRRSYFRNLYRNFHKCYPCLRRICHIKLTPGRISCLAYSTYSTIASFSFIEIFYRYRFSSNRSCNVHSFTIVASVRNSIYLIFMINQQEILLYGVKCVYEH